MKRQILSAFALLFCIGLNAAPGQEFLGKNADGWVKQLQTGDAKQRRSAAFALGKLGRRVGAGPVNELRNAFAKETDPRAREAIVSALAEVCRDVQLIYLAYIDDKQQPAADALAASFPEICLGKGRDLEQVFLTAVSEGDPHLRRSGVLGLGSLSGKSADSRKALATAITDQEPMVRQNAAWALGRYGEEALPSLAKALRDGDSLVKRDAAGSLMHVTKDAEKVRVMMKDLLKMCEDTNSEVKRAALNVLVLIVDSNDKDAIPVLRNVLNDRDLENKRTAALALSNIGGEGARVALSVLLESAKEKDLDLRRQAIAGLANLGSAAADAVPELMRFLREDSDAPSRAFAAHALGGIGKASAPALSLLVQKVEQTNEDKRVRVNSAMAIARMGDTPATREIIPNLLVVLANAQEDIDVRERVVWALRSHGAGLRNIKGTRDTFERILNEKLTDDNRMLRYDCAYMLGMVWQFQAPERTLVILGEFLEDKHVKVYDKTVSTVGGVGIETKSGTAKVQELGKGDGRTMAIDALTMMGPGRYTKRPEIMNQLRALRDDPNVHKEVRDGAAKLLKKAQ